MRMEKGWYRIYARDSNSPTGHLVSKPPHIEALGPEQAIDKFHAKNRQHRRRRLFAVALSMELPKEETEIITSLVEFV